MGFAASTNVLSPASPPLLRMWREREIGVALLHTRGWTACVEFFRTPWLLLNNLPNVWYGSHMRYCTLVHAAQ